MHWLLFKSRRIKKKKNHSTHTRPQVHLYPALSVFFPRSKHCYQIVYSSRNILFICKHPYTLYVCVNIWVCMCVECMFTSCLFLQMVSFYKHYSGSYVLHSTAYLGHSSVRMYSYCFTFHGCIVIHLWNILFYLTISQLIDIRLFLVFPY